MAFSTAGVIFTARGVETFIRTISNVNRVVDSFNTKIERAATRANKFEDQFRRLGNLTLVGLITAITAAVVAIGALSVAGLSTAASFENAFADVTKTVDAFIDRAATAHDGVIRLTEVGQEFRDELKQLSFQIPVTFEELSAIAGLGGQLGVVEGLAGPEAQDALLRFTETVAGLGEATNLTQEKAATGLAQISNIFRSTVEDIGLNVEQLGSTIVELGNTSAATESLILNFSQRIAGAGQTVGLTQAEVLGIGTAFASIGITAEAGSTAVNRALLIINEAVSNSTDKFLDNTTAIENTIESISDLQADLVRLEAQTGITGESLTAQREAFLEAGGAAEDFGRQLGDARREQLFQTQVEIDRLIQKLNQLRTTQGTAVTTEVFDELLRVVQNTAAGAELTAEAFRDIFREDPAEAFALFVEGLAEEGERAGETLDRIGLGSVEATRAFLAMSGASDLVRDRIEAANEAFEENSALTDEVSIRYATLKSNFEEFINVVRGVTDTIFSPLIDPAVALVEWGKEVILVFGEQIPAVFQAIANKFGPELKEIFDEIFGSGLFAGGEITTPEGLVLSGEAIGIEAPSITALNAAFENLIETINSLDVSNLSNQAIALRDTIVPIWTGAVTFATENTDLLIGAVKGLTLVLASAVFVSAITKAATLVGILFTPVGQLTTAVIALGIAWETNFLGIQDITSNVISDVMATISRFAQEIGALEIPNPFEGLFGGGEEVFGPTGDIISGDQIGIDPTLLQQIAEAAEWAAESFLQFSTVFVEIPINKVNAVLDIFHGISTIIEGLGSDRLTLARTLDGLKQTIDGFFEFFLTIPRRIAGMFGLELDVTPLKDAAFKAGKDFIEGFLEGISGIDVDLGSTFGDLIEALGEFGESAGVQTFISGLSQIWEGVQDFSEAMGDLALAIKELIGLEPDDSLFVLFGQIAGFVVSIGIEALIKTVEGITGLVVALTGLANLDFTQTTEGLTGFATALLGIPLDIAQKVGEIFEIDVKLTLAQGVLDLIASLQENLDEGFISLDMGMAISEWTTRTVGQMTEGINTIIQSVRDLFATNVDAGTLIQNINDNLEEIGQNIGSTLFQGFTDLDVAFTLFIDNLAIKLADTLSNIDLGIPFISEEKEQLFLEGLSFLATKAKNRFIGLLDLVNIGIPSFQGILDKAEEVVGKIKDFFTGLFDDISFDLPDFGILQSLADLGLIDLEVEAPDTDGLGTDLAQGVIDEVEEAEQTWSDAWLEFITSPIETSKEVLGIESPSTVTQEMAEDLVEGFILGLSDLTALEQAIMGIDSLLLSGFTRLSTELTGRTIPTVQRTDRVFQALYSDTLPRTTSAIIDDLVPAKLELAEVNESDLIPSVEALIEVEENLGNVLDDVRDKLDRLIERKEKAKDRAKSLTKEIELLAKAYLALASAIGAADQAGDGLTSPPSAPSAPPPGTPFQTGGSFIVPSGVGTEGMPIRVHSGELVQIIPANFTKQLQSLPLQVVPSTIKAPQVSGASINNSVNHQTIDSSSVKEFHLHVQESPTSDVRDSFDLMESLT